MNAKRMIYFLKKMAVPLDSPPVHQRSLDAAIAADRAENLSSLFMFRN